MISQIDKSRQVAKISNFTAASENLGRTFINTAQLRACQISCWTKQRIFLSPLPPSVVLLPQLLLFVLLSCGYYFYTTHAAVLQAAHINAIACNSATVNSTTSATASTDATATASTAAATASTATTAASAAAAAVEPRCLQSSWRQLAQGRNLCSNAPQLISYFLQLPPRLNLLLIRSDDCSVWYRTKATAVEDLGWLHRSDSALRL